MKKQRTIKEKLLGKKWPKKENIKIIFITGGGAYSSIYGLGTDNNIYIWDEYLGAWYFNN